MNKALFTEVDQYIEQLFAPSDKALATTLQSLAQEDMPRVQVSPNQGKLLYVLALLCNARKILEIGTLSGYSTIWMARALPGDGRLVSIEHDPKHARVAKRNITRAGLSEQVDIRVGRALDVLPQLEAEGVGPFDMVFIDADKQSYGSYLHWTLRLTRPGSLIVADNVVRDGKVVDPTSTDLNVTGIQQFNTALAAAPEVAATIVQMVGVKGYDGMALAVVRPRRSENQIMAQEITMSGSYAKIYRQAREALEREAEMRLERGLTPHERNLFRNCGTLTALETLGMKVYFAESADELAASLAEMSMDSRFGLAVDELVHRLEKFLGRSISTQERQLLRRLGNIEELWFFEQRLYEVPQPQREHMFSQMLKNGSS